MVMATLCPEASQGRELALGEMSPLCRITHKRNSHSVISRISHKHRRVNWTQCPSLPRTSLRCWAGDSLGSHRILTPNSNLTSRGRKETGSCQKGKSSNRSQSLMPKNSPERGRRPSLPGGKAKSGAGLRRSVSTLLSLMAEYYSIVSKAH